MKYTEEIFNILSRGGFISSNSLSPAVRRYYDTIEEELSDYYDYYKGIGFYLEGGNGYYFFARNENKVDIERKLEAAGRWIDYLCFLKTYNSAFGPGLVFSKSDIVIQIRTEIELKDQAKELFSEKKNFEEIVDKLINELERMGFIEKENETEATWRVLTAFHYIEELVDCINITDEEQNEIPE